MADPSWLVKRGGKQPPRPPPPPEGADRPPSSHGKGGGPPSVVDVDGRVLVPGHDVVRGTGEHVWQVVQTFPENGTVTLKADTDDFHGRCVTYAHRVRRVHALDPYDPTEDTVPETETTTEQAYCRHRALKGGRGVNDASGVREWGCDRPPDHGGDCQYTRDLGLPSTAYSAVSTPSTGRRMEILAVREAMDRLGEAAREVAALEAMPLDRLVVIERQTHALRALVSAFGPRREVIPLAEDVTREIQRWV